ncbi:MAG: (Fe-S)-binding protein [Thermoproteota archaeon]
MDEGGPKALAEWLRAETSKCAYCGFCEPLCPTLSFGPHRGYGPRGRVNVVRYALEEGLLTKEALSSLYSCILCAACVKGCPAGIDIPGVVRAARSLAHTGFLKGMERFRVEISYVERR